MTLIIGLLQFLLILYICFFEFKRRSSAIFLWATLLLMFGVMNLLNSLFGDVDYSDTVIKKAGFFALCFCIIYLLSRMLFQNKYRTNVFFYEETMQHALNNRDENVNGLFYLYIGVFAIKLIPYVRYAGSILSTSWGIGRDYSASLGYINITQVTNIVFYALSGIAAFLWLKGKKKKFVIVILLLIFNELVTRNRIEVLPILCCVISLFLWKAKKIDFKAIFFAVIGAIFVIYIVYGLRVFRHYGTISNFLLNATFSEFFDKVNSYILTGNGELGLIKDMYFFIENNNNFESFGQLHSYKRMLLVYLPTRFSFGLKPEDFAIAMGQAVGMAPGGSTHPTLLGDCYANAGMLGIMLGIFWAGYVTIMDYIINNRKLPEMKILAYILTAVVYVIIGRGSVYNGFWFVAYGIPTLCIFEYCLLHLKVKNRIHVICR